MKDFGDLIYVIAIIAWVIYSFVSKANKQKNKRKTVDETTERPEAEPDIKEILEQLMGKKKEEHKPSPNPVYETRKPSIEPVYDTIEEGQSQEGKALNPVEDYQFGNYKTLEEESDEAVVASQYEKFNFINYSEQTAPHSIEEKEGIKEVVHLEEETATSKTIDFDIEKAIIYSEILKRPKWV